MSDWFYARGGQQHGPVDFEKLRELAASGAIAPADLVWTPSMKDWQPAASVPELSVGHTPPVIPPRDPANPYAAPSSAWVAPQAAAGPLDDLAEIPPGSEPLQVGACIKRGFDLTFRHIGMILLIGLVYLGVSFAASFVLGLIDSALGWGGQTTTVEQVGGAQFHYEQQGSVFNILVTQVLSIFLSLGLTRIGLEIVSGRPFSVGQLFGEGRLLLPALGATILYGLMVVVGLVLLIVPGIYLALRYGQYMNAMVDRRLGVMESLRYSSSITTNNRLNLLALWLLGFLIAVAGLLALCIGLVFALPIVWLAFLVAYRWMQYGPAAAADRAVALPPPAAPPGA